MISEKQIQNQCIEYLKLLETRGLCYWYRSQAGSFQVKRKDSVGYMSTGRRGCPDITIITKRGFIALEIKSSSGKLSEAQKQTSQQIAKLGSHYIVVRSVQELIKDLNHIMYE